ncbi:MAG: PAS domain S-box protein, partial [Thermodesulfovibrionales bacterium]
LTHFAHFYPQILRKNPKSKDELICSLSNVFTPESYSAFKEALIAIAQEKHYFEAETVNKTLRGEDIHILVRLAIPSETSRFKNLLVNIVDITEHKRAEDELMERFRHLTEVAFDGVAVIGEGVFLEVNKPFARMFGYELTEMIGLPVSKLVAPEYQDDVKQKILSAYEKPYELTGVRKDGRQFPLEACGKSFLSKERTLRIVAIRDITDRKKTEGELLKVLKLESLGVLAGGIAHDFNNILTAIMGNISLAMLYVKPGNELFDRLLEAENASMRARSLTQQLLTFSKGGTPVKKTASIVDLIKESAGFVLRGSHVKCDFILEDKIWPVEVDEGQMSQVIQNLVINADQAMPDGGTISVRVENNVVGSEDSLPLREGRYVKIMINDHGIGIPDEYREKIFDPFFTTKQKGSGLGLSTAYSIIKKHDGYITVESEIGSGTTFFIYLPASRKRIAKKQAVGGVPISGAGKVLFMDDEEMVRNTAGEMLRRIGYTVEFARDGAQLIEVYVKALVSGQPFDAVIMDLTIPGGMGGKETIKKLLEIDPAVKAIVSSGYSNDPVMADYKKHGFVGVIAKPYRIKQLSEQLIKTMKPTERTEH